MLYSLIIFYTASKSKNKALFIPAIFTLYFNNLLFNVPEYLRIKSTSQAIYSYREIFIVGIFSELALLLILISIINYYIIKNQIIILDKKFPDFSIKNYYPILFSSLLIIMILTIIFNGINIYDPRYLIAIIRKDNPLIINFYHFLCVFLCSIFLLKNSFLLNIIGIIIIYTTGIRLYFLYAVLFFIYRVFILSSSIKSNLIYKLCATSIILIILFIGISYSLGYRFDGQLSDRLIGYFNRNTFNNQSIINFHLNTLFLDSGNGFLSHFWLYIPRILADSKPYDIGTAFPLQYLYPGLSRNSTPSLGIFINYLHDFGAYFPLGYVFNLENLLKLLITAALFFFQPKNYPTYILVFSFLIINYTLPFIFQVFLIYIVFSLNNFFVERLNCIKK